MPYYVHHLEFGGTIYFQADERPDWNEYEIVYLDAKKREKTLPSDAGWATAEQPPPNATEVQLTKKTQPPTGSKVHVV